MKSRSGRYIFLKEDTDPLHMDGCLAGRPDTLDKNDTEEEKQREQAFIDKLLTKVVTENTEKVDAITDPLSMEKNFLISKSLGIKLDKIFGKDSSRGVGTESFLDIIKAQKGAYLKHFEDISGSDITPLKSTIISNTFKDTITAISVKGTRKDMSKASLGSLEVAEQMIDSFSNQALQRVLENQRIETQKRSTHGWVKNTTIIDKTKTAAAAVPGLALGALFGKTVLAGTLLGTPSSIVTGKMAHNRKMERYNRNVAQHIQNIRKVHQMLKKRIAAVRVEKTRQMRYVNSQITRKIEKHDLENDYIESSKLRATIKTIIKEGKCSSKLRDFTTKLGLHIDSRFDVFEALRINESKYILKDDAVNEKAKNNEATVNRLLDRQVDFDNSAAKIENPANEGAYFDKVKQHIKEVLNIAPIAGESLRNILNEIALYIPFEETGPNAQMLNATDEDRIVGYIEYFNEDPHRLTEIKDDTIIRKLYGWINKKGGASNENNSNSEKLALYSEQIQPLFNQYKALKSDDLKEAFDQTDIDDFLGKVTVGIEPLINFIETYESIAETFSEFSIDNHDKIITKYGKEGVVILKAWTQFKTINSRVKRYEQEIQRKAGEKQAHLNDPTAHPQTPLFTKLDLSSYTSKVDELSKNLPDGSQVPTSVNSRIMRSLETSRKVTIREEFVEQQRNNISDQFRLMEKQSAERKQIGLRAEMRVYNTTMTHGRIDINQPTTDLTDMVMLEDAYPYQLYEGTVIIAGEPKRVIVLLEAESKSKAIPNNWEFPEKPPLGKVSIFDKKEGMPNDIHSYRFTETEPIMKAVPHSIVIDEELKPIPPYLSLKRTMLNLLRRLRQSRSNLSVNEYSNILKKIKTALDSQSTDDLRTAYKELATLREKG